MLEYNIFRRVHSLTPNTVSIVGEMPRLTPVCSLSRRTSMTEIEVKKSCGNRTQVSRHAQQMRRVRQPLTMLAHILHKQVYLMCINSDGLS